MAAPGKPGAAFVWGFRDSLSMEAGSVRGCGVAFQTAPDRCPKSRLAITCMTDKGAGKNRDKTLQCRSSHAHVYNHGNGASPY